MTSIELKRLLTQRISEINDISFLQAIKSILDSNADKEFMNLTAEQANDILHSKNEIEQGFYSEQEIIDLEVAKWAKEK
ncbi:MAG: hypothetical protein FJX80_06215 [Bacteroidetes bacterium]|nr:hypothetical protein [Bacteroidota bacterium]